MKKTALILICIMLLICAASCGKSESSLPASDTDTQAAEPADTAETTQSSPSGFYVSEEEVYEITGGEIPLHFPTKWQDKVVTSTTAGEGYTQVSFSALLGGYTLPLYDFVFGNMGQGYLLGALTTASGEQSVYLIDRTSSYQGGLSAEDELTYYEMCEAVNDIISKLVYENGMTIAG